MSPADRPVRTVTGRTAKASTQNILTVANIPIVLSSVPERVTWAMTLVGSAGLGLAAFRNANCKGAGRQTA
jgi:hypothetical protein